MVVQRPLKVLLPRMVAWQRRARPRLWTRLPSCLSRRHASTGRVLERGPSDESAQPLHKPSRGLCDGRLCI